MTSPSGTHIAGRASNPCTGESQAAISGAPAHRRHGYDHLHTLPFLAASFTSTGLRADELDQEQAPRIADGAGSQQRTRLDARFLAPLLAMLVVLIAVGAYALYRPAANADLVDYIATVQQWRGLSGQALSDATYRELEAYLTPAQYADVTGTAGDPSLNRNVYLRALAADPSALEEQIPFYSVKPLYPGLMLGLGAIGIPLGLASVLISATAYVLLGVLLLIWFRRHLGPWTSTLMASLLVISPPFWVLSQLSSPDALALLLVASAALAFAELRRPGLSIVVLLIAILARPNAALIAIALIGVASVARPTSGVRLRPIWAVGGVVATVAVTLVLQSVSENYGLGTLYYHAVVAYLPHPAQGAPAVPLADVAREYVFRTIHLALSPVPWFTLMGALAIVLRVRRPLAILTDPISLIVVAAFVAMVPGWLTYPNEPERILVGSFLPMVIALVVGIGDVARGRTSLRPDPK